MSNSELRLTDRAAKQIHTLARDEEGDTLLRLRVDAGGCSGFQYAFNFVTSAESDDHIIETLGARLVIDGVSLELLQGAEVDYQEELIGASFVVRNPNAASSCGCGNSFSL